MIIEIGLIILISSVFVVLGFLENMYIFIFMGLFLYLLIMFLWLVKVFMYMVMWEKDVWMDFFKMGFFFRKLRFCMVF